MLVEGMVVRQQAKARTGTVRVLIADDDSVVRTALTELIQSRSNLLLVGAAVDARQAISMAAASHPDVALIDYRMPGGGDYATREIVRRLPETVVLCLSAYDNPATKSKMLEAGAMDFLVKGVSTIEEIIASIEAAVTAHEHRNRRTSG